jgi:uncharacterized membrane protein YbhN (UPF0104 family)
VALLVLGAWGATRAVDPAALGAALASVERPWVALAALLYVAAHSVSAMVWAVSLRAGGCPGIRRGRVLQAHWVARGACELVPGHLGEAARLTAIRGDAAARAAGDLRVAGSMGAWKLLDGAVTALVVTLIALVTPLPGALGGLRWVAAVVVGLAALLALAMWRLDPARALRRCPGRVGRLVGALADGAGLLSSGRAAATAAGLQVVFIALRIASLAALLIAFGVPPAAAPLVYATTVVTGYLPISPGGVGVREAALVPALVAAYGLALGPAAAVSLGIQALSLVVSLAGCALALAAGRAWPAQARRMRKAPIPTPATREMPLQPPWPSGVTSSTIIASGAR